MIFNLAASVAEELSNCTAAIATGEYPLLTTPSVWFMIRHQLVTTIHHLKAYAKQMSVLIASTPAIAQNAVIPALYAVINT